MAKQTVAEILATQLADFGVKQVFGITGDALNPFTDALRRDKRIEWLTVRHEETAAFAAAAQAELTQDLAVCAGTIGPGAVHLLNGLYNAKRDRCPVLAITGQIAREETAGPYFQETNLDKLFDDVCVFSTTVTSAEAFPRLLQQAVNAAVVQRGVVHLAIPTDVIVENIPKPNPLEILAPQLPPCPSEAELQQLADMIQQSNSVSLLIGRGCRDAKSEVAQLAELLSAPIARSAKGTESLDHNHSHNIGGIGHVGTPHGLAVMDDCDLLLMLGTDFPYKAFLPQSGKVVQIDLMAEHLGRRCELAMGLVGDIKATLTALLPKLTQKDNKYLAKLQAKRDKWSNNTRKKYLEDSKRDLIHPQAVVMTASDLAADDAVFTADIGEATVWLARYLNCHHEQRLISSFNHGSLGVGLPAAIGAQVVDRKRQVISISGDGGFGMLMADLVTAARYDLNITQIILNNGKFGFVELEMEASGYPRYATDLVNPDFAKVAEACGWQGITIKTLDDLKPALESAINTNKPVLLDVFVNPNELIIPSELDIKTAFKYMNGKLREMLIEKNIKVLFEH